MTPRAWRYKPLVRRAMLEGAFGHGLFTTKDPDTWKSYLEELGTLCANAWHDDLPEADREWAEAQREKFRRWVDDSRFPGINPTANTGPLQGSHEALHEGITPPWAMLLEAVKSAFLACIEGFKGKSERETAEAEGRLYRTYLWRTLSADDAAEVHRTEALRAFRRGFRLGQQGRPSSLMKPIPPVLEPPYFWGSASLAELPGPSAARERALRALPFPTEDPQKWEARNQALRELYASAWREDVPEEDREWAETYRHVCMSCVNGRRLDAAAQSAYEAYLQSSGGLFGGEPAPPWPPRSHRETEPWRAFAERVDTAPDDESEHATAEAAMHEYWDALFREAPPWDNDPAQAHWLAAVRAARAALSTDTTPKP